MCLRLKEDTMSQTNSRLGYVKFIRMATEAFGIPFDKEQFAPGDALIAYFPNLEDWEDRDTLLNAIESKLGPGIAFVQNKFEDLIMYDGTINPKITLKSAWKFFRNPGNLTAVTSGAFKKTIYKDEDGLDRSLEDCIRIECGERTDTFALEAESIPNDWRLDYKDELDWVDLKMELEDIALHFGVTFDEEAWEKLMKNPKILVYDILEFFRKLSKSST
jgi:hypothetical protein